MFILLFFLFLLKLPMIDIALLPYKQLICHMRCQKIWYLDIQHELSETSMIWICHRHCHKIGKLECTGSYPSNQIYSQLCKSRKRKMMCSFNRKYKKMIWTQSSLPVGLYVFRIKFGLCSYYFFLFLLKLPMIDIELLPTNMRHAIYQKILNLDIQHALSETSMIWICHRHCHKIGKLEWGRSQPSNQIYSQLCKTRNRKWCVDSIGNRKE